MALEYKKHSFGNIDGTQVTFVETGLTKERMEFLKDLLMYNRFEVLTLEVEAKEEGGEATFTLGVTDMMFNPVIWVYDRKLWTRDGRLVTHEYWNNAGGITKPQYWEERYEDKEHTSDVF